MRYFIYCRKSSEAEDRQVASIESQLTTLKRAFVDRSDIEIAGIYEESFSEKPLVAHNSVRCSLRSRKEQLTGSWRRRQIVLHAIRLMVDDCAAHLCETSCSAIVRKTIAFHALVLVLRQSELRTQN